MYIFFVLLIVGIVALAVFSEAFERRERATACAKAGGELIKVSGGLVCGKVEVVTPRAGS